MKIILTVLAIATIAYANEVRLLDLDPPEAQQYIDQQDTSLKYAPKIESNVPAVRYLGNEPHNVQEDIYLANQYHGQDGLGGYLYGYSVPDIAKTERKKAGGDLRGAYNYIAGNGQEIKVEYWDDGTGFHQVDNVPKNLPEDLPDVKAAKEEFARIWAEEAERNSHPIQNPPGFGAVPGAGAGVGAGVGAGIGGGYKNYQSPNAIPQPQPNFQTRPLQQSQHQPHYYQGQQSQAQPQYQAKPQPQAQSTQVHQQQASSPQQLVNQYQQQKQSFPNPGQQVHYQNTQSGSYYQGQPSSQGQGKIGGGVSGQSQIGGSSSGFQASGKAGGFQTQGQIGGSSSGLQASGKAGGFQTQGQIGGSSSGLQASGKAAGIQTHGQIGGSSSGFQTHGQIGGSASSPKPKTSYLQAQGSSPQSYSHGQASSSQQTYSHGGAQAKQGFYPGQNQGINQHQASDGEDDGEYRENPSEDNGEYHPGPDEEQGPPKGFFYAFDYPVGIIVQKDGAPVNQNGQGGNVHDVYAANKQQFEQQLHGESRPARSSSGYLYIPQ